MEIDIWMAMNIYMLLIAMLAIGLTFYYTKDCN